MKLRYLWILTLVLVYSCAGEGEVYVGEEKFENDCGIQERWICHNPESKIHGEECTPECFENGNPHKFCWLLTEEE